MLSAISIFSLQAGVEVYPVVTLVCISQINNVDSPSSVHWPVSGPLF